MFSNLSKSESLDLGRKKGGKIEEEKDQINKKKNQF